MIDVDIPQYEQIQTSNIIVLKKLLQIILASVPFKPNYATINQQSGISINTMKNYIGYLSNAELLLLLHAKGINNLGKPEKIYLDNPNLMYAMISDHADIGNIRETFFYNQVSQICEVMASPYSDFLVNSKFTFKVGGKSKKKNQILNIENSFVVKDDIETGYYNIVPLWLFGFLY